jgi:hypothetical protein
MRNQLFISVVYALQRSESLANPAGFSGVFWPFMGTNLVKLPMGQP